MFQNIEYDYTGEMNLWGDACGEGTLTQPLEINPAPVGITSYDIELQKLRIAIQT